MSTLKTRLDHAAARLSELEAARRRGEVSQSDDHLLGRVAEQTRALNEELEALEVLGRDAVHEMSNVIEQGLADLERNIAGLEDRTASSGSNS